jgi:uncharacterized protein
MMKTVENTLKSQPYAHLRICDLFLTRRCNFGCDYCFVQGKGCAGDSSFDTSKEILRSAVRFLVRESVPAEWISVKKSDGDKRGKDVAAAAKSDAEFHKTISHICDPFSFVLFGGEPLLAFDTIVDFVPYARREFARAGKEVSFSITTNGSLVTPEIMQFFRGYGVNLLLSIDGGRDSHNAHRKFPNGQGTFDAVVSRLPMMKYYQPWLGARVTPTPETVLRLSEDFRELYSLGINQFIIGCATGIDWKVTGEGSYETFISQMKLVLNDYVEMKKRNAPVKLSLLESWGTLEEADMTHVWGCSAGRYRVSIDVDGSIQACAKVQGAFDGAGFLPLGNVMDGFDEEGLANRREYSRFDADAREKCKDCNAKSNCTGGCPATNFASTRTVHACPESDCDLQAMYMDLKAYHKAIA